MGKARIDSLISGERIVNFSDAVFAFAATLLVLKIELPQIPPHLMETQFTAELLKLWPSYAANFISFLIIGYYWRQHHKLFIMMRRYDSVIVWLNTVMLIFIAFLPFPVDLFGEYSTVTPVLIFYTFSISVVGLFLLLLWTYAAYGRRLVDKNLSHDTIMYHAFSFAAAPTVFLLSIPLVMIDHAVAKISWIFVIILLYLLDVFYKRKRHLYDPQPE